MESPPAERLNGSARGGNSRSHLHRNRNYRQRVPQQQNFSTSPLSNRRAGQEDTSLATSQTPESPWAAQLAEEKRWKEFERTGLRKFANEARRNERERSHRGPIERPIPLPPVSEHLTRQDYGAVSPDSEPKAAALHIAALYKCSPDTSGDKKAASLSLTEDNLWKYQKATGFERYKGDLNSGYVEEDADGWEMEKRPTDEQVATDLAEKAELKRDVIQGWVNVHANQAEGSWHSELDKAHWDQDGSPDKHRTTISTPLTDRSGGISLANPPLSGSSEVSTPSKTPLKSFAYRPKKVDQRNLREPERDAPIAPVPSASYVDKAQKRPQILSKPRRLLLIMDLNGTLLLRKERRKNPKACQPRPYVEQFLQKMLADHDVMIWSSARESNVQAMVSSIFPPHVVQNQLVAIWAREQLGLTPWQFGNKVQVYKQLTKVWQDKTINPDGRYDQSNTLLIDDSILKAASEPYNIYVLPEYTGQPKEEIVGKEPLRAVEEMITACIRWQGDVSTFMRWKEERERKAVADVQQRCIDEVKEEISGTGKPGGQQPQAAPVNRLMKDW